MLMDAIKEAMIKAEDDGDYSGLPLLDQLYALASDLAPGPDEICLNAAGEICRLTKAIEIIEVGGNHLANILIGKLGGNFASEYPPDLDQESALRRLCATDTYDVWTCWAAIMRAKEIGS